ncbi:MAG: acetate--CoA ligase family protein [Phycisphaerae bacterium]|nr:acetate--CoA ligase family protein [Phycisphaerae bacterium]
MSRPRVAWAAMANGGVRGMARLHEYQGKEILRGAGILTPNGRVARSVDEARRAAETVGCPCVVKIQAWTTGRAALGGVAMVKTPDEAGEAARRMLGMVVGNFPVREVLVEERAPIAREFFVSYSIDDRARAPVLLLAASGGSGVEDRAAEVKRIACTVGSGPDEAGLTAALESAGLDAGAKRAVAAAVRTLFDVAKSNEARSLEINPLVTTADGRVMALDCRVTIDDAAVFRHPELGIDIARELDHPPTDLERVAYRVEQEDHRGTFFFAQMNTKAAEGSKGLVGFHGAGGGGSMMSMDAITNAGFTIANFTDTSGNPSAAKVYRAARVILSQPGLCGYFGSGSGVASQEQFWSAYGLAKAFWEVELDIPTVIRLGGNTEDRAVEILHESAKGLSAPIEGYKKSDPPAKIAARFAELVSSRVWTPRRARRPGFVGREGAVSFPIKGGRLWVDAGRWKGSAAEIVARSSGLLRDDAGRPALAVTAEELMGKDSELIACEVECRNAGVEGVFVELEIPGLQ